MPKKQSAYARAGVDYTKIESFKEMMIGVARRTASFSSRRGVEVNTSVLHAHGGVYRFVRSTPHLWCLVIEGLGNKNWLAEWMRQFAGTGKTYYDLAAFDTVMMAVNDCIAQGALPVVYVDEVAAGDSEWFEDVARAHDFAEGMYRACREAGMALVAGESPALRYLINARKPVKSAPSLSGAVVGVIAPMERLIDGSKLQAGDIIIGIASSGIHANGVSLALKLTCKQSIIGRLLESLFQKEPRLLDKLPSGRMVGEELLAPTRCYVDAIEGLLEEGVDIHALLPGTGGGVGKLAFDKRPYTYRVHSWPEVPEIFHYLRERGVSLRGCLTTFNWGVGYYAFVPQPEVERTLAILDRKGYHALEIGRVEEGKRCTIFEPEGITLPPPGV